MANLSLCDPGALCKTPSQLINLSIELAEKVGLVSFPEKATTTHCGNTQRLCDLVIFLFVCSLLC